MVTAASVIFRLWNTTSAPDIKNWLEFMLEKVSYEHLLAKLNNNTENFIKKNLGLLSLLQHLDDQMHEWYGKR